MNYERLKTFVAVAEKKSFSEAAKVLFVSQPTITSQIKALEEELHTKLFERTTKRVEMTEAALILIKYAREIIQLSDAAQEKIQEIGSNIHGDLEIGCSFTIGEYILPIFLKRFKDNFPMVQIRADISNSDTIISSIKNHAIDVGLIETPIDDPQIILEPFLTDELLLIAAPDFLKENDGKISAESLKTIPLIMREKGSGTRAVVNHYLQMVGILESELNIVMELGSTESVKAAVEAGLGASIISRATISKEKKLGLLTSYPIKNIAFYRYFYIAMRKDQVLKSTADLFLNELKKNATDQTIQVI